jgi:hypothetical protein
MSEEEKASSQLREATGIKLFYVCYSFYNSLPSMSMWVEGECDFHARDKKEIDWM